MASDPYHSVAAELRTSLAAAQQLARQHSTSNSGKESSDAHGAARLHDALDALKSDMADVRASVNMLEARGPERFGVDAHELQRRKAFVAECEAAFARLQGDARASPSHRSVNTGGHGRSGGIRLDEEEDEEEDEDATFAFEMEQQQQLLSRQDNTLDLIGNTLTGLRRQASHLGQEIGEQVELIGALDTEVDSSQSKLTRALGKMDELVRRSDDRMGGWCVWLLILILMLLVVVVIII